MRSRSVTIWVMVVGLCLINSPEAIADCPSADLTSDCFVDFEDFAVIGAQWLSVYDWNDVNTLANQWLTEGIFNDPCNLVWVYINDPGIGDGHEGFNGEMSKYETTNAQYCQFLNDALASGDITIGVDDVTGLNLVYGANGSNSGADFVGMRYFKASEFTPYSQIERNGTSFSVLSRDGYDMSNHPVLYVSWWGATAFCNYYGYRLPTEWEWQAVADYHGTFTYGCGTTIDHTKANYDYDNPLGLSSYPYTSPVNHYSSYGYGLNDMAGNVFEWTSSLGLSSTYTIRGGCWYITGGSCAVSVRYGYGPVFANYTMGFRVCR